MKADNDTKQANPETEKGTSMFEDLEQGLLEAIEVVKTGSGLEKKENMPTESYYIRKNTWPPLALAI